VLVATGCRGLSAAEVLAPDQLHVSGSRGSSELSADGLPERCLPPWSLDGDSSTLTVGLTWDLGAPRSPDLAEASRALREVACLLTAQAASGPELASTRASTPEVVRESEELAGIQPAAVSAAVSECPIEELLYGLGGLAALIASYLGRHKIRAVARRRRPA